MNLAERVPLPSPDSLNTGLLSPGNIFMMGVFGSPGSLSQKCSEPSSEFEKHIVTEDVGPFKATGHRIAVLSLRHVFEDVAAAGRRELLAVRSAGMLCVRAMRGAPRVFSNHSWGTAVDMYFGDDVVPFGSPLCERGMLALYPFFHAKGWDWGGGYHTPGRQDAMHMEASVSLIDTWQRLGMI